MLAHEVGHAKYHHLLFYVLFFLGYMVLSFGLFDLFVSILALHPYFLKALGGGESGSANLFYLALSIPIILTMVVYFRYIMGFFMRHFERQADLHSAATMGSPAPVISSLEKIALLSGKSRNLPSWHHFSIKERVDYLWRSLKEPGLVRRHNRFVVLSFIAYLICIAGLGYSLNFGPVKKDINYRIAVDVLDQQLAKDPGNLLLLQNLAMVYNQMEDYGKAIKIYERLLAIDGSQATALNNLAWLLVTAPDKALRDPSRALILAEKAVSIDRNPVFLDTLAEAYYANGLFHKAVDAIKEAISLEKKDNRYYKRQLKRFSASLKGG